jgi:hypothetical protein
MLLFSVACGDGSGPEEEAQDFTGTYTLVSFSQGTASGVTEIPGTVGDFTMTATTYEVTVNIPVGPVVLTDRGTYTAIGTATSGDFSQQSTDNPDLQYTGTYNWNATTNRLTLDTSSQGVRSVLVIQRT